MADRTGFEIRQRASVHEFKSHPVRQICVILFFLSLSLFLRLFIYSPRFSALVPLLSFICPFLIFGQQSLPAAGFRRPLPSFSGLFFNPAAICAWRLLILARPANCDPGKASSGIISAKIP